MTKFQTVTTVNRKSESQHQKPIRKISVCAHGRRKSRCKDCGGSRLCEHGRVKNQCKQCGGPGICEHGRQKICKDCGGRGICVFFLFFFRVFTQLEPRCGCCVDRKKKKGKLLLL